MICPNNDTLLCYSNDSVSMLIMLLKVDGTYILKNASCMARVVTSVAP